MCVGWGRRWGRRRGRRGGGGEGEDEGGGERGGGRGGVRRMRGVKEEEEEGYVIYTNINTLTLDTKCASCTKKRERTQRNLHIQTH